MDDSSDESDTQSEDDSYENLAEMLTKVLPYQFEPEREECVSKDSVDKSVITENICGKEDNLDRVKSNNWCRCHECKKEEREIDCLCCHDIMAISESQYEG